MQYLFEALTSYSSLIGERKCSHHFCPRDRGGKTSSSSLLSSRIATMPLSSSQLVSTHSAARRWRVEEPVPRMRAHPRIERRIAEHYFCNRKLPQPAEESKLERTAEYRNCNYLQSKQAFTIVDATLLPRLAAAILRIVDERVVKLF